MTTTWFHWLCVWTVLLVVTTLWGQPRPRPANEGFTQTAPFVLRTRPEDIYDDFYAQVYDEIHDTATQAALDVQLIARETQMSAADTVLDVGAGTGATAYKMAAETGATVVGIDRSAAMLARAARARPHKKTRYVANSACEGSELFEPAAFSHVLCLGATIYEFNDEELERFLRNAHIWLKPGGCLALHLLPERSELEGTMHRSMAMVGGA